MLNQYNYHHLNQCHLNIIIYYYIQQFNITKNHILLINIPLIISIFIPNNNEDI